MEAVETAGGNLAEAARLLGITRQMMRGRVERFSIKHADISGAMVTDKVASMRATGCRRVVSADCACLLNIGHAAQHQGAPLEVEHLASLLWRRMGGAEEEA